MTEGVGEGPELRPAESRFSARQARFPLAPLAPVLEMGAGLLPRVPAIPLMARPVTAACRLRRWAGRG